MGTALGLSVGYIRYTGVSVMFGTGLLMVWLVLAGYSVRGLSARAIHGLTGHLRARPDPWLEQALRRALADFDRELSAILHDRGVPVLPSGAARPGGQEAQPGQADNS